MGKHKSHVGECRPSRDASLNGRHQNHDAHFYPSFSPCLYLCFYPCDDVCASCAPCPFPCLCPCAFYASSLCPWNRFSI